MSPPPSSRDPDGPASLPSRAPPGVLPVQILPQPDDETCGPTCLHAVYRYWGEDVALKDVIASARSLNVAEAGRGTIAVMLGIDALTRGYRATLYTFNLHVFDPSWFDGHGSAPRERLAERIAAQAAAKRGRDERFDAASASYEEFLARGGSIRFRDLTGRMIARFIRDGRPVLTGLSATYLYRCPREYGPNDDYDDIRGEAVGHFVVLHGYENRRVTVADPLAGNPGFASQGYTVSMTRLVPAIMLGVLTHDANLLVIEPASRRAAGTEQR